MKTLKLDRWEILDRPDEHDETWVWCLHCERWYQLKDYRQVGKLQLCAYDGCNGDTVMDAMNDSMDGSSQP